MKFTRLDIPDIIICEPNLYSDNRGYFAEIFRNDMFEKFSGTRINFCQHNESLSRFGVMRGLHYQKNPHAQTKLVRVTKGVVLDIAVDIRSDSPTFGKHIAVKLTEENKKQILIPKGFAHGYVVLSSEAVLSYSVDNYYNKKSERGIAFDDEDLKINWILSPEKLCISNKDKNQPAFKHAEYYNSSSF